MSLFLIRNIGGVMAFPARYIITTLVVVLVAALAFREKPDLRTGIGLVAGCGGVMMLSM